MISFVCLLFTSQKGKWKKMNIEDESFLSLNNGLRTSNEGINQRNLEMWAYVADKICFGHT